MNRSSHVGAGRRTPCARAPKIVTQTSTNTTTEILNAAKMGSINTPPVMIPTSNAPLGHYPQFAFGEVSAPSGAARHICMCRSVGCAVGGVRDSMLIDRWGVGTLSRPTVH